MTKADGRLFHQDRAKLEVLIVLFAIAGLQRCHGGRDGERGTRSEVAKQHRHGLFFKDSR